MNIWGSSIVCYALGARPPQHVMEGFFRKIRGKMAINKIAAIGKGMYMVRFEEIGSMEKVLAEECQFFDGKPLIV